MRPWVGLMLTALIATGLSVAMMNDYQNWGDDWAQYVLQARAILDGGMVEYLDQNAYMVNHSSGTVGPIGYPWGLPLLLAAEGQLFGFTLLTFKLFNIAILAAIVLLTGAYAWRLGTPPSGLAAAALVGFNPSWVNFVNHVLSELPFTMLSMCWLIAAARQPTAERGGMRGAILMGALSFAAFTIRVNGVLLLVAGLLNTALDTELPRWRRLTLAAVHVVSFAVLWLGWSAVFPDGSTSYTRQLEGATIANTVRDLVVLPTALLGFFTAGRLDLVSWCFAPFAVIGAWWKWPDTRPAVIYCGLGIALYAVWPAGQPYRFMMPLMPIVAVVVVLGLQRCAAATSGLPAQMWRAAIVVFPAVFLTVTGTLAARGTVREAWHPYDAPSRDMFAWIREHTEPDAVVAFFKPRVMHLLGGRLSITAMSADAPRASYLVYGKRREWTEFQQDLEAYDDVVTLVRRFENQNFIVFAVAPRAMP